jgi:hypothetical protein
METIHPRGVSTALNSGILAMGFAATIATWRIVGLLLRASVCTQYQGKPEPLVGFEPTTCSLRMPDRMLISSNLESLSENRHNIATWRKFRGPPPETH